MNVCNSRWRGGREQSQVERSLIACREEPSQRLSHLLLGVEFILPSHLPLPGRQQAGLQSLHRDWQPVAGLPPTRSRAAMVRAAATMTQTSESLAAAARTDASLVSLSLSGLHSESGSARRCSAAHRDRTGSLRQQPPQSDAGLEVASVRVELDSNRRRPASAAATGSLHRD